MKNKINFVKLNERECFWRFSYFFNPSKDLIEQYNEEFRDKLREKGIFSQENLVANTQDYREEFMDYDKGELAISGSRKFMSVYNLEGSYFIEKGEYKNAFRVRGKLTKGNELEISLFLETPKTNFSKMKHICLKDELNEILRRF